MGRVHVQVEHLHVDFGYFKAGTAVKTFIRIISGIKTIFIVRVPAAVLNQQVLLSFWTRSVVPHQLQFWSGRPSDPRLPMGERFHLIQFVPQRCSRPSFDSDVTLM